MTNRGENYIDVIHSLLGSRPAPLGVSTVSCANFRKSVKPQYRSWRPPMFHVKHLNNDSLPGLVPLTDLLKRPASCFT